MAEIEQRFYDAWQEKEDQYDAVEKFTSGLFEEGPSIRAIAQNALVSVQGAFCDGAYHPDMNAGWRTDIYNVYFNRVFSVSENGELTIDMKEVEKILKKDAGEITAEEYDVIALAYLLAEDEDLAIFMQSMLGERADYNTSWYNSAMNYKFYSEWGIDGEKVEQIRVRLEEYAEAELKAIQDYRANGEDENARERVLHRGDILQRATLLDVVAGMGMFGGKYEGDCPPIVIKHGENGELLLEFVEGRIVTGSRPDGSTLRDSSITISDTVVGENIKYVQSSYSEYVLTSYFGSYSLGNDAGKFAVNKAKGMVKINQQSVKNLSNRMKQIPGKEWLGEAIGYIPFVGTVVKFGVDTIKNKNTAERNVKFIEDEMGNVNVAMVYSDFDCCVNFVDYDLAEKSSHEFYPYVGEETDAKISLFNEKEGLKKVLSTELTREIILGSPQELLELWQEVQGDDKMRNEYERILS